jgi:hypothetical protein
MTNTPALRDWKALIEKQLNKTTYTEEDILKVLYLCQDFLNEIQPAAQWLGQQQGFVNQMQRIFNDMYYTRFNKQPPSRPTEIPIQEVILDSTEIRKKTIRETALSLTKPGNEVSDELVLEELKRRGMKIDLVNPTATISTILRGFKPQFEKVQGKRGVFRRLE